MKKLLEIVSIRDGLLNEIQNVKGSIKEFNDIKWNNMKEVNKNTKLNDADKKLHISDVSKRYEDMEFAWISSATRLYTCFVNVELEKERFKEWFNGELAQNYIQNT